MELLNIDKICQSEVIFCLKADAVYRALEYSDRTQTKGVRPTVGSSANSSLYTRQEKAAYTPDN